MKDFKYFSNSQHFLANIDAIQRKIPKGYQLWGKQKEMYNGIYVFAIHAFEVARL